jgi:polyketide synthase 12
VAAYLREELFPERSAPGAGGAGGGGAAGDVDDAAVRELLLSIPPARLRESGLLDALLGLADGTDAVDAAQDADGAAEDGEGPSLDEMGLDDLVRMALKNDVPDEMRRS